MNRKSTKVVSASAISQMVYCEMTVIDKRAPTKAERVRMEEGRVAHKRFESEMRDKKNAVIGGMSNLTFWGIVVVTVAILIIVIGMIL